MPSPSAQPSLRPVLVTLLLGAALALCGCSRDTPGSLVASGKAFAASGDQRAATSQFKAALQLDPDFADARVQLGRTLLASSDPAGAALELTRALDAEAPLVEVAPPLARALVLAGDYKRLTTTLGDVTLEDAAAQAELKSQVATAWGALGDRERTQAAVEAALKARPEYGPALILQARILAGQDKLAEALAVLDNVLQQPVKLPDAWQLKGEILEFAQKEPRLAAEAYREALKVEPAFLQAHVALTSQHIRARDIAAARKQAESLRAVLPNHPMMALIDAQLALLDQNLPLAREKAQTLLRMFPEDLQVLIVSGGVESEKGNLLQAEAHFAKAVKLSPASFLARSKLAEVYLRLGQPASALEAITPLLRETTPRIEVLSLAGDAALRLGDATAAEAYFLRAAKADPSDTRLQTAVALAQVARGDPAKGLADLEVVAARSPDTYADEVIFSARLKRREFDAALTALDAIQRKAPQKTGLMELRGRVHLARRDLPAARAVFEQALQKDKASFAAISGLTTVDLAERKFEPALARLQDAVKADPRNQFALMAMAEVRSASGAPLGEVSRTLMDAIKVAPNDPQPRLLLMDLLLRKRQFKDALVAAQAAAATLPHDMRIMEAVGRAQMESGDIEQAITTYSRVAANEPSSARAHVRLAEAFKISGRWPQAEAALRKALEIDPSLQAARFRLLDVLIASDQRTEALAFTRKTQASKPSQPEGYLLEGEYHTRLKAVDAAVAAYRNGLAKTNRSEVAAALFRLLMTSGRKAEAEQFGAAWVRANPKDIAFDDLLAESHILNKDYAAAEVHLKRVLAAFPDNVSALNNMGWVLSQLGKPGAVANAQRAVDLEPDNAAFLDTLSAALASEGQAAKALATQQRAVELAPENHDLRLTLAKFALKVGDKDVARASLKRLLDMGPNYAQHAEVSRLFQSL